MSEHFQKAVKDADLISAWISGLLATIILSDVAHVGKPGIISFICCSGLLPLALWSGPRACVIRSSACARIACDMARIITGVCRG